MRDLLHDTGVAVAVLQSPWRHTHRDAAVDLDVVAVEEELEDVVHELRNSHVLLVAAARGSAVSSAAGEAFARTRRAGQEAKRGGVGGRAPEGCAGAACGRDGTWPVNPLQPVSLAFRQQSARAFFSTTSLPYASPRPSQIALMIMAVPLSTLPSQLSRQDACRVRGGTGGTPPPWGGSFSKFGDAMRVKDWRFHTSDHTLRLVKVVPKK